MKLLLLPPLLICCACSLLDTELPLGRPRIFEHQAMRRTPGKKDVPSPEPSVPDTTFYVSAVSFPPDYDWQRDTAYGATACTLKFYKGANLLLDLPAGPSNGISPSPDRNHIIGRDLYSEYSSFSHTLVKCNGIQLASWQEREILSGILPVGGVLHTVGLGPSARWFSYRRNGEVVLKTDAALLLGGFGSCTYGPTGAVYLDGRTVCFAYKTTSPGANAAYMVEDGKSRLLMSIPSATFLDIKRIDGVTGVLYNLSGVSYMDWGGSKVNISQSGSIFWEEGEILLYDGLPAVIGRYHDHRFGRSGFGIGWEGGFKSLPGRGDLCYIGPEDNVYSFDLPRPGWEDCYFFNRHCACIAGGELAAVLTPRRPGALPYFAFKGDTLRYNIHGFLSGVSVQIGE